MDDNKFEITGDIEHNDDTPRRRSIAGRFFLFLIALIAILSVILFPYFQEEFPALRRFTGMDKVDAPRADTVLLNFLVATTDSLRRANDSLKALTEVQANEQVSDFDVLVFEVQIGAFKHFDLEKYRENLVGIDGDQADGYAKLTLGKFFSPVEAKEFRDDIRKAGFKDAWIVAKRNGIRVEYDPATGEQIGE